MAEDIPTLARDGYLITFEILKKVMKAHSEISEESLNQRLSV